MPPLRPTYAPAPRALRIPIVPMLAHLHTPRSKSAVHHLQRRPSWPCWQTPRSKSAVHHLQRRPSWPCWQTPRSKSAVHQSHVVPSCPTEKYFPTIGREQTRQGVTFFTTLICLRTHVSSSSRGTSSRSFLTAASTARLISHSISKRLVRRSASTAFSTAAFTASAFGTSC
jgi:hypothetical protein